MGDEVCTDCTLLQRAALDAIIRHTYTESRLTIAKLLHDSLQIGFLEPMVEYLLRERSAAVRAYQEHIDLHAQKAAGSGV